MPSLTEVTVNIRGLAFGGAGVGEVIAQSDGRSDLLGITAFVPYSAVGETVLARVEQRKERYLQTELVSVTNSSGDRIVPRCMHFTTCGGCELQHITYKKQLDVKYEMILGALRAGKFSTVDLDKLEPVVAGDEYNYRRRITLHINSAGKVGFYRLGSRMVVPIQACPIATQPINEILKNIQAFGEQVKGKISSVLLEADETGVVAVLKAPYDLALAESRAILTSAKAHFPNALLFANDKEVSGYGRQILELPLSEKGGVGLRVPAGYFSQVNLKINRLLVAKAVELSKLTVGESVLDLYAGAGNFSLPFARAGAKVTAVECDKRLVALGRENVTRYGLGKNLDFIESSVEKFIGSEKKKNKNSLPSVDIIVADPPRSGLSALASELGRAERLLLISCHLPSFVRDTKNLLSQGWELDTIIPYDMFAQTSYVEILASFSKAPR